MEPLKEDSLENYEMSRVEQSVMQPERPADDEARNRIGETSLETVHDEQTVDGLRQVNSEDLMESAANGALNAGFEGDLDPSPGVTVDVKGQEGLASEEPLIDVVVASPVVNVDAPPLVGPGDAETAKTQQTYEGKYIMFYNASAKITVTVICRVLAGNR